MILLRFRRLGFSVVTKTGRSVFLVLVCNEECQSVRFEKLCLFVIARTVVHQYHGVMNMQLKMVNDENGSVRRMAAC